MRNVNKDEMVFYAFGVIPVVWLALLIAPQLSGGLVQMVSTLPEIMENPFAITLHEDSVKTVLIFLGIYVLGIGIYLSTRRNYRRGEEHGSARWGDTTQICRKYQNKKAFTENKILTQNFRIGLNGRKHRRNLNTLVVGGSGAGKTRFFGKPNVLQANTSYVILDPKGEILRDTGNLLKAEGYEIRVLDFINMEKSHSYNPFAYIRNENDVQILVTNLFKATTKKGAQPSDPFWDEAAEMLLMAVCFYLYYEAPPEEQNFPMVMTMLRYGEVHEDDDYYESPLDILFRRLEMQTPDHIAVRYYKNYHSGSAKTLKSIQVTLIARLKKYNLSSVAAMSYTDEMDLQSLGEKKVALFCVIPSDDNSFNFIISMLYTQLWQQIFYAANFIYGGCVPVHVHMLMDEFANVFVPEDFDQILSVMRSHGMSASIILQNIAQLKAMFEKKWEGIVGNCVRP